MELSTSTMNISEILRRLSTMEKNARYNAGPSGSIGAKNAEALHLALTIVDLAATEALIPSPPQEITIQVASTSPEEEMKKFIERSREARKESARAKLEGAARKLIDYCYPAPDRGWRGYNNLVNMVGFAADLSIALREVDVCGANVTYPMNAGNVIRSVNIEPKSAFKSPRRPETDADCTFNQPR